MVPAEGVVGLGGVGGPDRDLWLFACGRGCKCDQGVTRGASVTRCTSVTRGELTKARTRSQALWRHMEANMASFIFIGVF